MLVLSGFLFPLALLEPELSVVHQLADRGRRLRRDLDQIQALLVGDSQRVCGRHDAQLFSLGANQADFLVRDILIEFMH